MYRAFDYNGKRKLSEQIIDGIAEYVKIPDGGTGLDVGCGSGALTIACAKRNPKAQMVGCDIWSGAYKSVFTKKRCEDNAKAEGVTNAQFKEGNAVKLPFEDESFDAVTSNYVYHNITGKDRQELLETLRVLKKGGTFLLISEIYDHPGLSAEVQENIKNYHLYNPTPETFKAIFRAAGFRSVAVHIEEEHGWICIEGTK